MNDDNVSCPKCGNLCQLPKGSFNIVYIVVCLLCFIIGGLIIGIIGTVILLIYYVSIKDKPIQCPKCGYTWRR